MTMDKKEFKQTLNAFLENNPQAFMITCRHYSYNKDSIEKEDIFKATIYNIYYIAKFLYSVKGGFSTICIYDKNNNDLDFYPYVIKDICKKKGKKKNEEYQN